MADWSRKKVDSSTINNGQEYTKDKNVSINELNAMVNSGLYSQDFAEKLVTNIDTSEVGNVGTPSVSLVAGDGATADKPYKKFKFSNLKGDTGATGATGAKGDKGEKGDQGIQGEKGDQGVQGVRGEKGEKGDKGDTGATPNITATATTLPAGSSATVTKSGTAENPAFAFGIPKGDKGEKGEKGDKGESGLIYQTTGQNTDGAMSQKATTDELNKKVDKVNGKGLSTNDFTNDYKTKVDNNTTARHSHSNKTILDNTTASYTTAEKTKLSSLTQEVNLNITSVFLEANDTPTTIYTSSTSLVGRKFKIEFYYDTGAKSARSALKSVEFKVDTAISPALEMACDCGMYNTSTPECFIIGLALKYTNTTIIVSNRTTKIGKGTLVNPRKDYSYIYIKALYEIK